MSTYALVRPLLFALSPEAAHALTVGSMRVLLGAAPMRAIVRSVLGRADDPRLRQALFGCDFANPVGLAAGLDKDGVAVDAFAALGFSHVEIGTITARPQPGNDRPRLFRLRDDRALVNRMGFNNRGAEEIGARLSRRHDRRRPGCVLGVNVGKSKVVDLSRALDDYVASVRALANVADYLVVNVSSPNTPGLRDLQSEEALRPLLEGVRKAVDEAAPKKPLLLKIAPDLADASIDAAVDVALGARCDGLIATNTTVARNGLKTRADRVAAMGAGGLSGAPLRARSTEVLARVARRVDGRVPVIGVGGIDSLDAAWEKIVHGASLVQLYTGLIYEGPALVKRIRRGLARKLDDENIATLADAVGRAL
jgi:dihydroorotate dehydrogenase